MSTDNILIYGDSSCPVSDSWEVGDRAEGSRDMVVRDTQRKTYTETGRRGACIKTTREQQAHKTYCGPAPSASCICSLFGISLYSPATSTCTQFPTVAMLFLPRWGVYPLYQACQGCSLFLSPSLTWLKEVKLPCQETQKTECLFQMLITFLPHPSSAPDHLA